ncbi:hypothetical protein AB0B31_02920 [Catellatospora citrea]|uniref:hypothetical protein n=1 Tax=Catellatospora citrea TaxID=53366 RepID=UPI0033DEFD05
MRTTRPIPTTRQVAHGALLSLALLAAVGSAATAAPITQVGLNKAALQELTTVASADVTIGGTVFDTATLAGVGATEVGSITFSLYGPDDTDCSTAPVFVTVPPVPTNGPGTYGTLETATIPPAPGTYRWIAEYTGTTTVAPTSCDDANEDVVVNLASPTMTTNATDAIVIGAVGGISDAATLAGGFNPTGTITFNLYGPDDVGCSGTPQVDAVDVTDGNGTYGSAGFNPTSAGTYRWTARYNGDANNNPVSTGCNDPNESTVVSQATPTVITAVSDDAVTVGTAVTDIATLAGGFRPTGTITFFVYGPGDTGCEEELDTSSRTVVTNASYESDPFTPTVPGTYRWRAEYSGDANNAPVTTACNEANESVVVRAVPVTPTLVTDASRDTFVGKQVFDTATLSGGTDPTGTITFTLYGPGDATCSRTPVFTSTITINGNGAYESERFRPSQPGTYQWVAAYSGDSDNRAVSTRCGDPAEQVVVRKKAPYGGNPRP